MLRGRVLVTSLFVLAALANLPIVYFLVRDDAVHPIVALAFGLVAMGLAWAGGFHLEGRKRWFVLAMGVVGIIEAGAPFVLGMLDARPYGLASGALSFVALVMLARGRG